MGYLEVYEEDEVLRSVHGVQPSDSRSSWIILLDYLLTKVVEPEDKAILEIMYTQHNLEGSGDVPTNIDLDSVYWKVGEPAPVTSNDVLAMNTATLVSGQFDLQTGAVEVRFTVIVPPNKSITAVSDLTAGPISVLAQYLYLGTIDVIINSITYQYKHYEMKNAIPYATNHIHRHTVS